MHAIALLLAGAASAQGGAPALSQLAWMAGHWRAAQHDRVIEEVWMAPRGGLMPGLNRSSSAGGAEFEFLRIVEDEAGIAYVAMPGGGASTRFVLVEASPGHARFENPAHDFPTRISYTATGADALRACIGDGQRQHCWQFRRIAPGGAP